MKKQITIGVGEAATTAKELLDAWKLAERGETVQVSVGHVASIEKEIPTSKELAPDLNTIISEVSQHY